MERITMAQAVQRGLFGRSLPAARSTDPETSHQAAQSVTVDKLRRSQAEVLKALAWMDSGCDEDIYAVLMRRGVAISQSRARTARKELVDLGIVRETGDRKKLQSGCLSMIWEVVR